MKPPKGEPDEKQELERPQKHYDHYIELYVDGNEYTAVKKDTKPVFNEDVYYYEEREGDLIFEQGRHSCSGAGQFRSTTPSEKIERKIVEMAQPYIGEE